MTILKSILIGFIIAGLFSATLFAFALPYSPGETTNPTCAPTDANCTVSAPAAYSFGSNNFSGTGTFTTTGAGSFGSLELTTTALGVGSGGTGATTFASNGVLYGNGTSAVQATAEGGANTILTANAGAPSWSAAPTIGTSVTTPLIVGGTATTSDLSLQTTSGVGETGADMHFLVGDNGATEAMTILNNGNVGIGTTSPRTRLELGNDGAILATGTYNSGWTEPNLGAGTRMLWYPKKAAFRAGSLSGTQWNAANIGSYSVAFGYDTIASGVASTAMGDLTTASGEASIAVGLGGTASGNYSTAMGVGVAASGGVSTAMGYFTAASGSYSTAIG